jgi:transposase-like protein
MGLTRIAKSTVSKLCQGIDARVGALLERPLSGGWPSRRLDVTSLRPREGGRIVSVTAMIAVACDAEGRREIVGLHIGPCAAETFWAAFLRRLLKRGPKRAKLVVSCAQEGVTAAIARVVGATWQRCGIRWTRPISARPSKPWPRQRCARRSSSPTRGGPGRLGATSPIGSAAVGRSPARSWTTAGTTCSPHGVRARHRTKLRSVNTLERLTKQVKRRVDVVGVSPAAGSISRPMGAALLEAKDEWQMPQPLHGRRSLERHAETATTPRNPATSAPGRLSRHHLMPIRARLHALPSARPRPGGDGADLP